MTSNALLTKRSKPIFKPSTGRRSVSSSLGPALVDTGSKLNPPPSATVHRSGANPPPLHPGHHLRFGFGPIIRLQPRLEPLFFRHRNILSLQARAGLLCSGVRSPQTVTRICMAALPIARLCRGARHWIVFPTAALVVARPSKVSGFCRRPTAPPIPSGGAFFLPRQSPRRTSGCASPLPPAPHCSQHSSGGNALAGQRPCHAPAPRQFLRAVPARNPRQS